MEDLEKLIQERKIRPVHPSEVIADVLEELDMTQTDFAEVLGVSRRTVNEIIQGRRSVSVDMAIRIGKAFGNGSRLWLNLQQKWMFGMRCKRIEKTTIACERSLRERHRFAF